MITKVWVDDEAVHDATAQLGTALSLIRGLGSPAPRQDVSDRARAHGQVDSTRYYGGRSIDLQGRARGATVGDLHDTLDWLRGLFALDGGDHVLKFQREGRDFAERVTFRPASAVEYDLGGSRLVVPWAVTVLAADPRIYSDVVQVASYDPTSAASSSGLTFPLTFPLDFGAVAGDALELTNGGNYPTPPVWTVHGPGRGCRIVNEDTGEAIVLDADLLDTDYVTIDVGSRSVKLLDSTERPDLIDSSQTTWWELPARTTTVRLEGAGFQAGTSLLSVSFRDARI